MMQWGTKNEILTFNRWWYYRPNLSHNKYDQCIFLIIPATVKKY